LASNARSHGAISRRTGNHSYAAEEGVDDARRAEGQTYDATIYIGWAAGFLANLCVKQASSH
jgi:hypothetical protein